MLKLAPSLLAADFTRLGEELSVMQNAGAHLAHIDIMDGHFVPNITMGPAIVKSLRKASSLIFDVHLMIARPENFIETFADAGADIISFHIEATDNPLALIRKLRSLNISPAIALNPETPAEIALPFLPHLDMVLCMSVNPGFGGQNLIRSVLPKARLLRDFITKNNFRCDIEMDGGINTKNLRDVLGAGVNIVVAGTGILRSSNLSATITEYLEIMKN